MAERMARVTATRSSVQPAKVQFIEPMYALAVQKLPNGPDWLYEVKFDGYRCLAGREKKGSDPVVAERESFYKTVPPDCSRM
jgi:bifunctional non-homologous end joining protein LigD